MTAIDDANDAAEVKLVVEAAREEKMTYPTFLDVDTKWQHAAGSDGTIPTFIVIGKDGRIVSKRSGKLVEGGPLFEQNCGLCHGAGARSGGVVPDLRRSAALDDKALWNEIVLKGALKDRGMISFAKWFTPAQIEAIRGYVGEQAKYLQTQEAAATPAKPAGR